MGLGKRAPHSISEGGNAEELAPFFTAFFYFHFISYKNHVLPFRNDDGPWQESWQLEQLHS